MAETSYLPQGSVPFATQIMAWQTALAISYRQDGYISNRACPPTEIPKPTFSWARRRKDDAYRYKDTQIGPLSLPVYEEFRTDQIVDTTYPHSRGAYVEKAEVDEWMIGVRNDAMGWMTHGPLSNATEALAHILLLDREVRTANLIFSASNYSSSMTEALSGNDQFDNANGDPWNVLQTSMSKPLKRPNVAVFGQEVWDEFATHAKVREATGLAGTPSAVAMRNAVASKLGLEEVIVGDVRRATSELGSDLVLGRVWGKSVALYYRNAQLAPGSGLMTRADMRETEPYMGDLSDLITQRDVETFCARPVYQPLNVWVNFDERPGHAGAYEVIVRDSCKEKIIEQDYGYLLTTAVS